MYSRGRCVDRISTCSRAARCACSRRLDTFACATGLDMGQAGTSALGREEALQGGLLLLELLLGCLEPPEA